MRHHCSCTERCNKRHYNNVAEGQSPSTNLQGDIEFRGVHFSYPSRSEVSVFNGLDLVVPSGSVTAVVGASGSGKSTLPALLMRFYDPSSGVLRIDGTSVRDFSPQWLRSHISIVHQVPAQWPWFYLIFYILSRYWLFIFTVTSIMTVTAQNGLLCADVPLRNYSLTHTRYQLFVLYLFTVLNW